MRKVRILVGLEIDANPKTCGSCRFLSADAIEIENREWHCTLFDKTRGLMGKQKTPNRHELCLKATITDWGPLKEGKDG